MLNAIRTAPGFASTFPGGTIDEQNCLDGTGKTEAQIAQFGKIPPLERLGQPDDIADAVSFLAGPDGGWINAQVLRANGGFA